ncbi:MAG: hypothetical protein ACRC3Y_10475 [Romboutsia sp.]|uniref:hypothetical protein n=1 Tax=Romboutsia sp. TaxID=1965302 RepID=UPI003F2E102B
MPNISISIYSFSLQDRRNNEYINLSENDDNVFQNIINQFYNNFSDEYNNNENLEKIFKIEEHNEHREDEFNLNVFKIKSGRYGVSSEIVNTDTGEVAYTRDETQADVMPFYLSIAIPINESDTGLIIFQNSGVYGIKTIFKQSFQQVCNENNNEYSLIIRNVLPAEYIERFLNGGILKKVRFIRNNIPRDRGERIGLNLGVDINNAAYEEYVIHKPVGFIRNTGRRIQEFMNRQRAINDIVHVDHFEYDNIKLEFTLGGRNKTLNLSNLEDVVVTEDVTDELMLEGGHPEINSITTVLTVNSRLYLESMGLI